MSEIKRYKAIAKGDCEAAPHSWSKGEEYEVVEKPWSVIMASNEGQTNYRPDQKEKLTEFFDFIGEDKANETSG